jgi:hypothetical protein
MSSSKPLRMICLRFCQRIVFAVARGGRLKRADRLEVQNFIPEVGHHFQGWRPLRPREDQERFSFNFVGSYTFSGGPGRRTKIINIAGRGRFN